LQSKFKALREFLASGFFHAPTFATLKELQWLSRTAKPRDARRAGKDR
jgi:hypothetical protein